MFAADAALDTLFRAILLSAAGLAWIIVLTRIVGLRTFSKMTAFDFVTTIAIGSLLAGASQASDWAGFAQPILAIATLLAVQVAIAALRRRAPTSAAHAENRPRILMRNGVMLDDALAETRVSEADVLAKLREANVHRLEDVRAVVLETTGDISVLHGGDPALAMLKDVGDAPEM